MSKPRAISASHETLPARRYNSTCGGEQEIQRTILASEDPSVPIVMFAVGLGFSPMLRFLRERTVPKQTGRDVAKSLLFFGCWPLCEDFRYGDSDLQKWQELGIVEVWPAFSRSNTDSLGGKYVQSGSVLSPTGVPHYFTTPHSSLPSEPVVPHVVHTLYYEQIYSY